MLTIIREEGDGSNNTDSMPQICPGGGENLTFPRMVRRSKCPKSLLRKVDWNEILAKATEEDKKTEVTHPPDSESEDSDDDSENKPPMDLTGPPRKAATDVVLDLSSVSKSVEPRSAHKGYTMPANEARYNARSQLFRSTPLKEFNSVVKTPVPSKFNSVSESPALAKKSLFNNNHYVYEREVVSHERLSMTPNVMRQEVGVRAMEYQEGGQAEAKMEEVREYGHSNTSGYYSHAIQPYSSGNNPPHPLGCQYVAEPPPPHQPVSHPNIEPPSSNVFAVPEPRQRPRASTKEIVVNGKPYQILALLGKGGSSKVYLVLAKDNSLLAIKCVNLANVDEKIRRDHLNEIEHLMKMQYCRHIIKIIDHQYIPAKNLLYAVMERGDTDLSRILKERTSSGEGVPPEMILFYWSEILLSVKSIHDNNIIHRDLKPANFLLVGGRLKLIDFGIASGIDSEQTSVFKDSQSGTPNYMSPEAWEDLGVGDQRLVKIGRKTDVWSLGCILYSFLYGKTPFQEFSNPMAKFRAITNPNYKIPFPAVKGVPNLLIESCRLCLIYDKTERASIEDLLVIKNQMLMTPTEVITKLRSVLDEAAFEKARQAITND